MSPKRGESGLSGILLADKPSGLTSHDVVNAVRKATGERRVGHAGTLDPMATGLLVMLIGPATRLASYLTAAEKGYDATIAFGSATDTDDADGAVVRQAPVPDALLDEARARELLSQLVGASMQTPPAYSALKVAGQVAYKAARAGAALDVAARPVEVLQADLLGVDRSASAWQVAFRVSKGTYVRALARDLGERAGTAAHLAALRRTSSGALRVEDAVPFADLTSRNPGEVASLFADPLVALGLPTVEIDADAAARVSAGQALDACLCEPDCPADKPVAIAHNGALLAIYARVGDILKAQTVVPGGVKGGQR